MRWAGTGTGVLGRISGMRLTSMLSKVCMYIVYIMSNVVYDSNICYVLVCLYMDAFVV